MRRKKVKTVSVYVMRDPISLLVRYIGISQNPHKRFKDHLSFCYAIPVVKWIRELRVNGLKPIHETVISGLTRVQAKRVELRLMRLHRLAYGKDRLAQVTPVDKSIPLFLNFGTVCINHKTRFVKETCWQ